MPAPQENVPGATMVAFDQSRRSEPRSVGGAPEGFSVRGAVFQSNQAPDLVSFDSRHCYFLMVVFSDISIAQCRVARFDGESWVFFGPTITAE